MMYTPTMYTAFLNKVNLRRTYCRTFSALCAGLGTYRRRVRGGGEDTNAEAVESGG